MPIYVAKIHYYRPEIQAYGGEPYDVVIEKEDLNKFKTGSIHYLEGHPQDKENSFQVCTIMSYDISPKLHFMRDTLRGLKGSSYLPEWD